MINQPTDILLNIFYHLDLYSLLKVTQVCKLFNKLIDHRYILNSIHKDYPSISDHNLEFFKRDYSVTNLAAKNLENQLKYKRIKLEFKLSSSQNVTPFFYSQLQRLYIFVNKKLKVIDLGKDTQKNVALKFLSDRYYPNSKEFKKPEKLNLSLSRVHVSNLTHSSIQISLRKLNIIFNVNTCTFEFFCKDKILCQTPKCIVLQNGQNQVELINIETNTLIYSFPFPDLKHYGFTEDLLILANEQHQIMGIDLKEGKERFKKEEQLVALQVMDCNKFLLQTAPNTTLICDGQTGQTLYSLPVSIKGGHALRSFVSGSGKFVAYKKNAKHFYIVDSNSGKIEKSYKSSSSNFEIHLASNRLIIQEHGSLALRMYDLTTYQEIPISGLPDLLMFHKFGFHLDFEFSFLALLTLSQKSSQQDDKKEMLYIFNLQSGHCYPISSSHQGCVATPAYVANCQYNTNFDKKLLGKGKFNYHFTIDIQHFAALEENNNNNSQSKN